MPRASKGQRRYKLLSDQTHGYFMPLSCFVPSPVPLFTGLCWHQPVLPRLLGNLCPGTFSVFPLCQPSDPWSPAGGQTWLMRSFTPKGISSGGFLNCPSISISLHQEKAKHVSLPTSHLSHSTSGQAYSIFTSFLIHLIWFPHHSASPAFSSLPWARDPELLG